MVPLFVGMIAIMVSVSTVNLVICTRTLHKGTIEAGYVQ